jgi:hypothetical protein
MMGDFNALTQLDSGEVVHFVFPESVATPPDLEGASLMSDVQFLQAGHQCISSLETPKLQFRDGGSHAMDVKNCHKLPRLQPTSPDTANSMNCRTTTAQLPTPHDPPTHVNRPEKLKIDEVFRATTTRRPNAETPVALAWHLGMGRTGVKVLKRGTCKREWHDGAEGIVGCIGENAAMFRTCSRQNEKITQTQACGFSYRTCSLKLATATTTTAETTGRKGSPSSLSLSDSSYSRTSNGKE